MDTKYKLKPISTHLEGFFVGLDRTGKGKRKKPSVASQQQKKVAQFQMPSRNDVFQMYRGHQQSQKLKIKFLRYL